MIVCWRTVTVLDDQRAPYLAWIAENRSIREAHGICAELVLEPATSDVENVVVTIWPSHEVFDAWIATPERDRLTDSDVHRSVEYRPIVRYDVVGGYLNIDGLRMAEMSIEGGPH
jgi:heme-degrading monooxygenase HmoA